MEVDIAPWIERKRLYDRDGASIIQTSSQQWVVKYTRSRTTFKKEIGFLRKLLTRGPPIRNMIELPVDPSLQFGECWYAMRRYTGSVSSCCHEVRSLWRTLAIDVLNFLEDLHRGHRLVHLDITLRNILFDRESRHFVVSDYELLEDISTEAAVVDDSDDHLWYYIGFGAELSAPIESWRMDLTMLGYALDELVRTRATSYDHLCFKRRRVHRLSICDYDIIARRNEEMANCHSTVRAYLDRLASLVDWRASEPPPPSVYDELRALFTQRNHTTFSDDGGSGSPSSSASPPPPPSSC